MNNSVNSGKSENSDSSEYNSDNSPSLPFILKSAYRKFELSTFHRSKVTVIWKQETAHCNNADKCRELKMNAEKFREMQRNADMQRYSHDLHDTREFDILEPPAFRTYSPYFD